MLTISEKFAQLKAQKQAALIPFVTMGYPSLEETKPLIKAMVKGGADLIELGIPFSDPLADGPVIQETSQTALKNGMTVELALQMVKELRQEGVKTPFIFMGYANPFHKFGISKLAKSLKEVGVNGVIIPDLPPTSAGDWLPAFRDSAIDTIFFASPTTSSNRLKSIIAESTGFLYCISVAGVTGARRTLPEGLNEFLKSVREQCSIPLALGFGLSEPDHIRSASRIADGAIIASAILQKIAKWDMADRPRLLKELIQTLKQATLKGED